MLGSSWLGLGHMVFSWFQGWNPIYGMKRERAILGDLQAALLEEGAIGAGVSATNIHPILLEGGPSVPCSP